MAALALLRSALGWRARPVYSRSFRQPQRSHRLTPSDDELLQKTTVHHLERESPDILFIEGYTNHGFTINGTMVIGPCAILPQAILQWNVGTHKDIIPGSLALFHMLEPKIEIVVLGTGARVEWLDPAVLKCLQQRGIAVEVQNTPNACATFNFLVSERRVTAAGLIPPPAFVSE
ncbi:NADH dehydrogenase [ubiquinone] 1 alpha subcomplex assembly factor 3 [Python bivittatus]|uniref:NADH dehydrogenase [ubiquinone] 1 alpha subcomplex assembly factor 3 n=1 Tax=Python bivittatus TaxID=176946 RepID=A0A9F5IRL0_PYTBI|nr:NADH dehydrogenase [ubiquinone] 1 alpha subcomplex assembly factor 3 [Python bivittatus]XP_025024417.1 NADH dehydrogenase [ubiquinone] 1 alpha subcomplex assembly factor 3 [Python bivittatus]